MIGLSVVCLLMTLLEGFSAVLCMGCFCPQGLGFYLEVGPMEHIVASDVLSSLPPRYCM